MCKCTFICSTKALGRDHFAQKNEKMERILSTPYKLGSDDFMVGLLGCSYFLRPFGHSLLFYTYDF